MVISLIALVFSLWFGILSIRKARHLPFFRMRRETHAARLASAWPGR